MTPQDIDAVLAIDRLSFPSAWTRASYARDLANPKCHYIVAALGREIIAYAGLWVVEEEAHITTLAVYPRFRHRGLGRRLLCEIIRIAQRLKAEKMTLEVRLNNTAAIRLYEGFGFVAIGKIRHYYLDTGEDAQVMCLDPLRLSARLSTAPTNPPAEPPATREKASG